MDNVEKGLQFAALTVVVGLIIVCVLAVWGITSIF